MIIFHSDSIEGSFLTLTADDSAHCARVLRHRVSDEICVIDGVGTMYECVISDAGAKAVRAEIKASHPGWNSHPYHLTMAVCPTKNNDRYEWFVEKATEIGVDKIVPLIGEHSERKVFKADRVAKIALSAAKQSLKAAIPQICEPVCVSDFLKTDVPGAKFIAYCFDDPSVPRIPLTVPEGEKEITILIGPEGDFSLEEAQLALSRGYVPVHLGESRLRTETAAVVATTMVYTSFLK